MRFLSHRFLGVLFACAFLSACGRQTPLIVEPLTVSLDRVARGGKVRVSALVQSAPPGTLFEFQSTAGMCNPARYPELITTFTAPFTDGDVTIVVSAVLDGKLLQSWSRSVTVGDGAPAGVGSIVATPPPTSAAPHPGVIASAPPLDGGALVYPLPSLSLQAGEFLPAGWMGDGESDRKYVQFDPASMDAPSPPSPPSCQKWTVTRGPQGFAAVAWQYPAGNFGTEPGKNLSGRGFTKVSFWARGARGGESVEFFAGGTTNPSNPYQNSLPKTGITVSLSQKWAKYSIDLTDTTLGRRALSNVICAFGWAVISQDNPVTFYLDDIEYTL